MLNSTSAFTTRQVSLARKPEAQVLIKDYSFISGYNNDDIDNNIIGGSAKVALAVKFTPSYNMTIDHLKLFLKSDTTSNEDITIEIQTASALASGTCPSNTPISNGEGKIFNFTDLTPSWKKVYFENNIDVTSGTDYYVVAKVTGSAYSYYWAEDQSFSGGEWQTDTGNDGTWGNQVDDKSLIFKVVEIKEEETGTITGIVDSGGSAIIEASAASWSVDQWKGQMLEISSSGASGDSDNIGMQFYILGNTVSSVEVDYEANSRGIYAGDGFFIESLNNFQEISNFVDFMIDDQRDRTVNNATITLFNEDSMYYETSPRHSLILPDNEVIIKLGYSGAEKIQQFRGFIQDLHITDSSIQINLQDIVGKLQRIPYNSGNIDGVDYEAVIKKVCKRFDIPFLTDVTNETISAGTSFNENYSALDVINKIRESLSWRIYGDNYGRCRFKNKVIVNAPVFELKDDEFILKDGLILTKAAKETLNIIGATNVENSISISDEVLIGELASSAIGDNITINFASSGVYGNIWWEDSINDGSVFIEENGLLRDTGINVSGTGSLDFAINTPGGTPNYNIKIYGSKFNLSSGKFYIERSSGGGQTEIGINSTKLLVQNRFFKTNVFAQNFADMIMKLKGFNKSIINTNCRGIADLEIEDSLTITHDAVDPLKIFLVKGQSKEFSNGKFKINLTLEDTLIRYGDIRYDIGLEYDVGVRYDGG